MSSIYYVNPAGGNDSGDGLSPASAFKTHEGRVFLPGDSVLFRRGCVIRGVLEACSGEPGKPVFYGAYGVGERPAFLGSVAVGNPEDWEEYRPNVWRCCKALPSEACNLIFNGGRSSGHLRWQPGQLVRQGQWHYTGIGSSSSADSGGAVPHAPGVLTLYSEGNPGTRYDGIECALWGERRLASGKRHIVLDGLSFQNGGVHGYQEIEAGYITIRNCEFCNIGGAVWSREHGIRFGNAVEFWEGAKDILVEDCVFRQIYDSGVTHQGCDDSGEPQRIVFRNNLFIECGMAAYECRGPAARDVVFENNTCVNAGGDLSMQGEPPPRQSEIHPQPMGHHVFIWRIAQGTQTGSVVIRKNIFFESPYGAAIYSIIDPVDERQFVIDGNCYWQTGGELLALAGGRAYQAVEFDRYRMETGHERTGMLADPMFADPLGGDWWLQPDSPCRRMGIGCLPREGS